MPQGRRLAGLVLPALLLATPAQADFCSELEGLIHATQPSAPAPALSGATCDTALQAEGQIAYCLWRYPFRAAEATTAFEALIAEVQACLGPDAAARSDQQVNHPDSYDARLFQDGSVEISISLKDKTALSETLLFLRANPVTE